MFRIANIHQTVVASPAVGVDDTFNGDMASDILDQRGFRCIGNNFGIDVNVPYKDAKHNRLATGALTSFTTNPVGSKVRFTEFDYPFEGGLFVTFLSDAFSQYQENGVNISVTDMGQSASGGGGKIEGGIMQNLSELSP